MPLGGPNEEPIGGEINPMDFINNCCDDGKCRFDEWLKFAESSDILMFTVVGPSVHDDDVFVNLDAFDMFVEFPDLELDAKSSFLTSNDSLPPSNMTKMSSDPGASTNGAGSIDGVDTASQATSPVDGLQLNDAHNEMYNISDYSPEWAYPEGGVKVLVTGPWDPNTNYTVLFDAFPVPTTIVQSGVLRCYCPAHEVGLATLQVACDGYVISNSVIFEYKAPPHVESVCEGTANDSLYKLSLYNRLESIDERMQIKSEPKDLVRIRLEAMMNVVDVL